MISQREQDIRSLRILRAALGEALNRATTAQNVDKANRLGDRLQEVNELMADLLAGQPANLIANAGKPARKKD